MSTANINIRVDDQLKASADNLFDELGLNMTTAITMFLKAAVRCDGIPFDLKRERYNAETIAAIRDAMSGQNLHGPFDSIDALMEDLNA